MRSRQDRRSDSLAQENSGKELEEIFHASLCNPASTTNPGTRSLTESLLKMNEPCVSYFSCFMWRARGFHSTSPKDFAWLPHSKLLWISKDLQAEEGSAINTTGLLHFLVFNEGRKRIRKAPVFWGRAEIMPLVIAAFLSLGVRAHGSKVHILRMSRVYLPKMNSSEFACRIQDTWLERV